MKNKTRILMLFGVCLLHVGYAQQGLVGEYYNGANFEEKKFTRTDAKINFVWDNVAPGPGMDAHQFSVRWTGKIKSPQTGKYLFRAHVDDGIRVWVGGQMVIDAWGLHDSEPFNGTIWLEAGRSYDLKVEYYNGMVEGEIQLFWQLPDDAPVFGGALGYNDKLIDSRYFFLPEKPAATEVVKPISTKPAQPTQPAVKPAPLPAGKPVVATPAKPVVKPAPRKTTPVQPTQPSVKPVPKPARKPAVTVAVKPPARSNTTAVKPAVVSADTLEKYLPKNIHFVKSKSEMLPESTPELDRLAGFLLRNPKLTLTIEGHTDKVGDSGKNQELSESRAQAVAAYLVGKGVSAQRITAIGYGDTRPLVKEGGDVRNRRVEFVIR